jgi:iron complex outermembrane receptor protein
LTADVGIRYDFIRIDALKFYQKSRWEERNYQQDFSEIIIREFPTQLLTNPRFDYHNLTYALGFNCRAGHRHEFRLNYTFTRRAPNPSELFSDGLHHGAARIELGDLRIEQERSHKIGITINGNKERFQWDLAPYLNLVRNFVVLEPTGVEYTIRGAFPVWEFYQTDARIWGVDGQLTANWSSHWYSNHSARYINGQDKKGNRPLINIPAPQISNSIGYEKSSWKSLNISLEGEYNFRQTRYPNNNFLVFLPESDSYEELDISTPPEGYLLINLQASARFEILKPASMEFGISIRNLANTRYRDYLNRLRYFADDLGRSFGLNLTINF